MNEEKLYPYQIMEIEDLEGEVWKPIDWIENINPTYYSVSNYGRVRSNKRIIKYKDGRIYTYPSLILKQSPDSKNRYLQVIDSLNVHRLVGIAFIPNPNNLGEIDHIDGNPKNNISENLRWVSRKSNMNNEITKRRLSEAKKGVESPLKGTTNNPKLSKEIVMLSLNNEFQQYFPSSLEINRQYNYDGSGIIKCCRHVKSYNSHYKHHWLYLDEYLEINNLDREEFYKKYNIKKGELIKVLLNFI